MAHPITKRTGVGALLARPAVRAGAVVVVLWLATAVILRGSDDFGSMIAILVCVSFAVGAAGSGARYVVGQLVVWLALLAGTALVLWESPQLPTMLVLVGAAGGWSVIVEPILRARLEALRPR